MKRLFVVNGRSVFLGMFLLESRAWHHPFVGRNADKAGDSSSSMLDERHGKDPNRTDSPGYWALSAWIGTSRAARTAG